ncbi:Cleavage and polyadenylation specificity factor subunit 1 [Actinomortierella ambigua]|uniref:Cleavage and polyadenylation specificity factor subunit 1 n=1 Tax=Actinomortierella ambigua TaxID=1343610 RepID=A0A9P6U017_9FUNG|nr:Cleavage and polyadenylation specificity factor subunit 1 [Actinomortierella ambigua]
MSMFTLAKEIFPPTSVENVVRCNFVLPHVLNVIIARNSVLEIYNFVEPAQADQLPRLELVATYRLNGVITSMGVIRTTSSGQHGLDSILVSFKDAKMSLLEWSFSNHSLVTVSIHYYERDDYKQEFLNNAHPTEIRVDPSRRCALLTFYGDRVAVLPFRTEEVATAEDDDVSKKWPYLPSYVMTFSDIDVRIKNVIDMQFLYDFYEPTLAILFSPQQTWTGRLATYPIIYSIDHLPYDCTKIIPMPKPIGGMLVVSANALIHLDQGSTGMGVGVNGYAPSVTEFPLDQQGLLEMALEGAHHAFLAPDQILFSLRDGDLYVVHLQQEGRSLSGFRIEKAGSSIQLSCTCALTPGYFFAGSRYGDSMLIKYSSKEDGKKRKKIALAVEAMDLDNDLYGQDMETMADQKKRRAKDEVESAMDAGDSKWLFEVCDTITNTGPIVALDIGQRASNEAHEGFPPQHEIVASTGSPNNGALVVFQRNIRPNVIRSTDALAGAKNIWTVFCRKEIVFEGVTQYESRGSEGDMGEQFDKFMIISKDTFTLVLATGDELRQLPNSQFYVEGPTVAIGTLLDETRVVQVYANGVRLLNADGRMTQFVPMDETLSIVAACIVDPYILLQFHDGSAMLLKGDMTTKEVDVLNRPSVLNSLPIAGCCIYSDVLNAMTLVKDAPTWASLQAQAAAAKATRRAAAKDASTQGKKRRKKQTSNSKPKKAAMAVDEVDLDLYGPDFTQEDDDEEEGEEEDGEESGNEDDEMDPTEDQEGLETGAGSEAPISQDKPAPHDTNIEGSAANPEGQSVEATHWCVIFRADGALEIYHLPDFKEVFFFPHFDLLPNVLPDAPSHQDTKPAGYVKEITELALVNFGTSIKKEPYLIVRTLRGNIIMYKTYMYYPSPEVDGQGKPIDLSHRLALRFRKIPHSLVVRETPEESTLFQNSMASLDDDDTAEEFDFHGDNILMTDDGQEIIEDSATRKDRMRRRPKKKNLIPFTDVAGYEGLFCLGASPLWILSSGKRLPKIHPMICDGKIQCFTQFHNVNCKNGFITCNAQGNVRISQLPTEGIQYDMPWPIRKVPLKRTVRQLKYHPTSQTYCMVTSVPDYFIVKDELAPQEGMKDGPTAPGAAAAGTDTAASGANGTSVAPTAGAGVGTPTAGTGAGAAATATATAATTTGSGITDDSQEAKAKISTGRGGRFLPKVERETLELVSPVTWETVDRHEFQEYEHVTSMECVSLESSQDASGRKKFIAVGTSYVKGEDSTMRGTIYIFDIIEVVPEPDNPQTDHKLKLLHSEDVKGAVTALAALTGYLLTCVGTKVVIRSFEDNETLTGIAFIDVQIFVTSVKVVKNTIILADAYKSVWFIGFQDEPTKLVLLGKDYSSMEAMNVSYLIENQSLYITVADAEKNIRLLQYAPFHVQSVSGQRLICRGDYHVGSQLSTTVSVPKIVLSGSDEGISYLTLGGTLDGSLMMITPIPEKTSKRLGLLSSQIVNGVQHPAGLNPRAFRILQSKDRLKANPIKGILDGDLLLEFANLPVNRQKEMTKQIGTSVDRVMDDLAALTVASDHF